MAKKVGTELITDSWKYFQANFSWLWKVALLLSLPSLITAAFGVGNRDIDESDIAAGMSANEIVENIFGVSLAAFGLFILLFFIISVIYNVLVWGGSIKVFLQALTKKTGDYDFSHVLNKGWEYVWQALLLAIVVGLMVALGLFFLIIPGLIILFFLSLSFHVLIDKKTNLTDAIKGSYNLVKSRAGEILLVYILLFAISIGVGLLLSPLSTLENALANLVVAAVNGLVTTFSLLTTTKLYLAVR